MIISNVATAFFHICVFFFSHTLGKLYETGEAWLEDLPIYSHVYGFYSMCVF